MKADRNKPPTLVTPLIAKKEFHHLLERVQTIGERFLIVRRRQPEAVLLSIEDFLEITGHGEEWIEEAWKATQDR